MAIYAIMKNHRYLSRWKDRRSGSPFQEDDPRKTYLFRDKGNAEHVAKQFSGQAVVLSQEEAFDG